MKHVLLAACAAFLLISCETSTDSTTEQARSCMDAAGRAAVTNPSAAATQASACEAQFFPNGATSATIPEQGKIGVGLVLIEEQKIASLTQMAQAMQNQNNSLGTAVNVLIFTSPQAVTHVTNMVNYAQVSASTGAQKLANIINFANQLNFLGNGVIASIPGCSGLTGASSSAIGTCVGNIQGSASAAQQAALVGAAVTAQQQACSGSGSSSDLCNKLTQAIGANPNNPTAVLNSIQAFLAANN